MLQDFMPFKVLYSYDFVFISMTFIVTLKGINSGTQTYYIWVLRNIQNNFLKMRSVELRDEEK